MATELNPRMYGTNIFDKNCFFIFWDVTPIFAYIKRTIRKE